MYKGILIISLSIFSLVSCKDSTENRIEVSKAIIDQAPDLLEKKKNMGDTLVLSKENLNAILPDKFDGYELAKQPILDNQNFPGTSWSKVKKEYKNAQNSLMVSLVDYNGAYGIYAGAISVFSNVENEEEKSQIIALDNGKMKAWESYNKTNREASLLIGIADRYLVTIELNNQDDTENIKTIVDKIRLRELPGY